MRAAGVKISTEMWHTLLDLPATSEIIDQFFDPWTRDLVLIVRDDQFPEKQEGERYVEATPIIARAPMSDRHPFRFVHYAMKP